MNLRPVSVLYVAAGALLVVAIALRLIPPPTPEVRAEAVPVTEPQPAPSPSEQAAALLSYQEIVSENVFDPDRRPPVERYVPPELAVEPAPRPAPDTPALPRLRLFGVAVGPDGAVALIDADPAIPGAEVYRPGDRVGGSTIVSITETTVLLEGPTGRRVLTLPSSSGRSP